MRPCWNQNCFGCTVRLGQDAVEILCTTTTLLLAFYFSLDVVQRLWFARPPSIGQLVTVFSSQWKKFTGLQNKGRNVENIARVFSTVWGSNWSGWPWEKWTIITTFFFLQGDLHSVDMYTKRAKHILSSNSLRICRKNVQERVPCCFCRPGTVPNGIPKFLRYICIQFQCALNSLRWHSAQKGGCPIFLVLGCGPLPET